ncbi:restriction modification system DNA specificity subunit [Streptococcus pneumoniae]|nr:restriction modification system DNA specificity subunit [Streptococcus pneumoniae]
MVFDKIDIDKSYFKYVVEKGLQDAVKHTHGSTMKHLTKKYFDNIMVSYTNLGEQQRIASELDLLSKLILRRQEQLEELNLLVKSRFNEMFGDPLNNNKKFAVKTGQQCFKFSSGKFLDKHDRVFEGYPAYGGNGIAWKSRKYLIDNPTIIIGRVGAYCGNVRTTHGKVQKYILPPLALQNEFADFVVQADIFFFACEIAIKVWRNSLKFSII